MHYIEQGITWFKDILFPQYCLMCEQEGTCVCESCVRQINFLTMQYCPVCRKECQRGFCCYGCASSSAIDQHVALLAYEEGKCVAKMIWQWKYAFVSGVEVIFKNCMQEYFACIQSLFVENIDYIIPVPLHRRRYCERGFNQAEHIAQLVAIYIDAPVVSALKRKKYTQAQAKKNREERTKNMSGVFSVQKQKSPEHLGTVLLIDDVLTTGSTLQACADALKQYGAETVITFTLARA